MYAYSALERAAVALAPRLVEIFDGMLTGSCTKTDFLKHVRSIDGKGNSPIHSAAYFGAAWAVPQLVATFGKKLKNREGDAGGEVPRQTAGDALRQLRNARRQGGRGNSMSGGRGTLAKRIARLEETVEALDTHSKPNPPRATPASVKTEEGPASSEVCC